jgi:alpha-2-macroglobulin
MLVRRFFAIWMYFLLGLILVLGIVACNQGNWHNQAQPLSSVEALPTPQLPDWIEQISPTGDTNSLAQIRIRFKQPLIPIESLESAEQKAILSHFELTPPLPGQFRFLTPKMIGFQADQALPNATRVRVTLKSGLTDLKKHQLKQDLAWTFNTEQIRLTNLPELPKEASLPIEPITLNPKIEINSNVELDLKSVNASLITEGSQRKIPLQIEFKKEEQQETTDRYFENPQEKFNPATREWLYVLSPQQTLEKATRYQLEVAPGIRPLKGNLASAFPFKGVVMTYAPLAFQGIAYIDRPNESGAAGRFVRGFAQLTFNNGLVAESAAKNITITPSPKESIRWLRSFEGDREVGLNPWALEPQTTYKITIAADLKDKFGQTLEKPATIEYKTGDVAADFWAPSGLNIFPATKALQLNLSAVNLADSEYKAAYQVVQPADLVYIDSAFPREEDNDVLPKPDSWQTFKISAQTKNQSADIAIPLREKLPNKIGMLAYGVQAKTYQYKEKGNDKWREPAFYGLVQLTNLGVFSQWFPESGLIRVHHLSDGSAVNGAKIEVYRSQLNAKSRPEPQPCATGVSDRTGTFVLNSQAIKACIPGNKPSFAEPPELLTIVREGQDWAFSRALEWSGGYGFGIYAGWDSDKPESRGTIFSDRQLYQPGEKAWFTGVATYLKNGVLQQDQKIRYTVTLIDPKGTKTELGTQTTNDFGTFSLEVPIAANQPLGNYRIEAKGTTGAEISGEFRVAEFKPANFKVDLAIDKEFAIAGQTVNAQAQSNYLFGPAVEGGKAEYYATRQKVEFTPKGWEEFSFGRQWFYPEQEPTVPSDVVQNKTTLDAQGKGQQSVTVAQDLPYPMTYRVDAQVTDVSNLAVANSKPFTALPSDRLIGLKSNFVADAGKPFNIQVIVTDPTGSAIARQPVKLELQQMIYSSVTQVIEGSQTPRDQVEYKTVGQAELRSDNTAQVATLTPPVSGSYRIRANFADAKDELTATDLQIWATGDNPVVWGGRYSNNRLELQLDKKTYRPGETANVVVQSPYPEAELYLAVVRHNTIYKTMTKVQGGAPQIQFKVTPDMVPNAAVEAILVRQGNPVEQVEPGQLDKLVRIGFTPFTTNLDEQYLKVQVTPEQPSLQPGAEETIQLDVKNAQGNPVQGQFTVMVVNEAVLQLTNYRLPDLVKTVYAEQAISTRFADNRPDVVLEPLASPIEKGWGFGGGISSGIGDTHIRKNFKPLAYYNGSVLADTNGKAIIKVNLPDDLTTWRVMAVAIDKGMHYGTSDATFMTTKPLVASPVLPQFARLGDQLEAGLSVTNNTGQPGTLTINGDVSGSLQLTGNKSANSQTQIGTGTSAYRFPMTASNTGQGKVQFLAQLNNTSDAFEVPLDIKPLEVTEQVVETGTTEQRVRIPINIDRNVVKETGGLEISLASTLIPELKAPARQVFEQDELPFLESAASQLAIAANLQILSRTYEQTFDEFNPSEQAAQALEQLQTLQRPDGGFAFFSGAEQSDPFVSPYVAQAISKATTAKFSIDSNLVNNLKAYLQKVLADPGQYEFCKNQGCKDQVRLRSLIALSELGDTRNDFLADLYERRNQFDQIDQIKLARYLSRFPEWREEADSMVNQIQKSIYETGRTATVNLPQKWRWFSSPVTAQSETLRLFVERKSSPETLGKLLSALLSQRQMGTWGCSYYNAQALTALAEYSQGLPKPPSFGAIAQLDGKTLLSHPFDGYRKSSVATTIAMSDLPRGKHDLQIQKSGQGTLHYLAAYRYRPEGNPPGRFNGLRITRLIHPANQTETITQMGLQTIEKSWKTQPGQVFDVELEVITDHPIDHVVISDPLPAGLEAIDTSFQTSTSYFQAKADSWAIDYQTIYRDRIMAYAGHLEAGVYRLHYLVRSITPGTFLYPGAEAHMQYAPEEFGRSASTMVTIAAQ